MLYRPVSQKRQPRQFFSGTVKEGYEFQYVGTVAGARIEVKKDAANRRYVVEAAIPLAALELKPAAGLKLGGDFGVTYCNPAADDTVLRSHWSSQATELVADEVWELVFEPKIWGTIAFE